MTRAHLPGSFRNSTNVVWIDTTMHRCVQMEEDTDYSLETLSQGRISKTPVPAFSMFAGTPTQEDVATHNFRARALRRMLAAAFGAWVAFGLLLWLAQTAANGG